MSPPPKAARLLMTGAAGGLDQVLHERLRPYVDMLRLSDFAGMPPATHPHGELVPCNLADKQAVDAFVAGCDAVVHLGGHAGRRRRMTPIGRDFSLAGSVLAPCV